MINNDPMIEIALGKTPKNSPTPPSPDRAQTDMP